MRVSGKLHYRMGCDHPYQIDADEIEIMPDESSLPKLGSFKGIITSDKSSEQLLDEERDGQW